MAITHAKVSLKADGEDATLVRASDWNANHSGTLAHADLTGIGATDHHAPNSAQYYLDFSTAEVSFTG